MYNHFEYMKKEQFKWVIEKLKKFRKLLICSLQIIIIWQFFAIERFDLENLLIRTYMMHLSLFAATIQSFHKKMFLFFLNFCIFFSVVEAQIYLLLSFVNTNMLAWARAYYDLPRKLRQTHAKRQAEKYFSK